MEDSLDHLLQHWKLEICPDPNFRAEVWHQIAAHKRRLAFRIWSSTEQFLTQPVWAAIAVVALLYFGATLGSAFRNYESRRERVAGLTAYILSVNPVAHAESHHP